jgi:hypothetical protein
MKTFVTFLMLYALTGLSSLSQAENCTSPSDRNLTTQTDVEKWNSRSPAGCDTVVGTLRVNGAGINDLSPLTGIKFITGGFLLRNTAVVDLEDLTSLNSVGQFLQIRNNDTLLEIDGLTNLVSVGTYLRIRDNDKIENINGLDSLASVGSYIRIDRNVALLNLDGLSQIIGVNGNLQIINNAALLNLDGLALIGNIGGLLQITNNDALLEIPGLSQVTNVGARLVISNNLRLLNINGLSQLANVGGRVDITNNLALLNLDGLSKITTVSGRLRVRNNDGMTNIDGLASVVNVDGNLEVDRSAKLTQCAALIPLLDSTDDGPVGPNGEVIDVGGTVTIASNGGASCNTVGGILASFVEPAFTQLFSPGLTSVSGSITGSTVTFNIDNMGSIVRATGLNFTNTLPAGLVVANPASVSTTCTGGTLMASSGSSVITYDDGLVTGANSCTVKVNVSATAGGQFTNTTGDLTVTLGNSGSSTASITVDDTPPVITLNGDNPMSLFVGGTYTDPEATAIDQPGDTSVPVTSSNNVDTGVLGSYTAIYDAIDGVGNVTVQKIRTVNVVLPPAPTLSVSSDKINFGDIVVGQVGSIEEINLTNAGSATLAISAVSEAVSPFSRVGGSCTTPPFDLLVGESCTLQYQFSPTASEAAQQALTISSNASSTPDMFTLEGAGVQVVLALDTDSIDFGDVVAGQSSQEETVTLSNTGTSVLSVSALDEALPPFAITGGSCTAAPFTLDAGNSCTLEYTYTPTAGGASLQSVAITSNANSSPNSLVLEGNGQLLERSYTGTLPSGNTGSLSFTSSDLLCTFDGEPQFLPGTSISTEPPEGIMLIDGIVQFAIKDCAMGATVDVTVDYSVTLPAGSGYWKVDSPAWREITAIVNNSIVTYTLTDGGVNDDDGTANGRIVDPSGAANNSGAVVPPPSPTPVPVNNLWTLLLLALGLIYLARLDLNLRRVTVTETRLKS